MKLNDIFGMDLELFLTRIKKIQEKKSTLNLKYGERRGVQPRLSTPECKMTLRVKH